MMYLEFLEALIWEARVLDLNERALGQLTSTLYHEVHTFNVALEVTTSLLM